MDRYWMKMVMVKRVTCCLMVCFDVQAVVVVVVETGLRFLVVCIGKWHCGGEEKINWLVGKRGRGNWRGEWWACLLFPFAWFERDRKTVNLNERRRWDDGNNGNVGWRINRCTCHDYNSSLGWGGGAGMLAVVGVVGMDGRGAPFFHHSVNNKPLASQNVYLSDYTKSFYIFFKMPNSLNSWWISASVDAKSYWNCISFLFQYRFMSTLILLWKFLNWMPMITFRMYT